MADCAEPVLPSCHWDDSVKALIASGFFLLIFSLSLHSTKMKDNRHTFPSFPEAEYGNLHLNCVLMNGAWNGKRG